jgi:hypothetical protein
MTHENRLDDDLWDVPRPTQSRYKLEGFAETRDALVWVGAYAPNLKFGLTLEEAFSALNGGFLAVRSLLKDAPRIAQWEEAREMTRQAYHLFKASKIKEAKLTLQQAEELFGGLRRIGGAVVSRQRLGDTEHGANEVDE